MSGGWWVGGLGWTDGKRRRVGPVVGVGDFLGGMEKF